MLELTSNEQPVHLSPGTSVQLEYNSPLFDEDIIKGDYSYSFNVPAGPNGPLYGFPERPDRSTEPGALLPAELALDGLPLLAGTQRVKSASVSKYSVSLQAGLSGAQLSERQLSSFSYGGLREVARQVQVGFDGAGNPLLVPGLMLHANEVVKNPKAYPYVFAPLRNEYVADKPTTVTPTTPAPPLDPLDYPEETVNQWRVYEEDIFGVPAGGSFTYRMASGIFGPLLTPYCPFPRLRYVLQAIFEESGLLVDAAAMLPGELGELVIVGNAQLVDWGDYDTLRFSLADVLPALTVAELLGKLRQALGLVVYLEPLTNRVRTAYLVERVAADAAYIDLTTKLAGWPEATIGEPEGLTLTYEVDSADELTKDLLAGQPEPDQIREAVATAADLPATEFITSTNLAVAYASQVRQVRDERQYYLGTAGYMDGVRVRLTWTLLGPALAPVVLNGGGNEQTQGICYTTTRPTRFQLNAATSNAIEVPAISQPPYLASQKEVERSSALRLLFYRGLQFASDGLSPYPQLSRQSPNGLLSVELGGDSGTYEQLLKNWLPIKLRGTSYKQALLLSPLDLAQLDLTRQLWLDGVPYLVRKLSATVPLKKTVTAELVRV